MDRSKEKIKEVMIRFYKGDEEIVEKLNNLPKGETINSYIKSALIENMNPTEKRIDQIELMKQLHKNMEALYEKIQQMSISCEYVPQAREQEQKSNVMEDDISISENTDDEIGADAMDFISDFLNN